MKKIFKLMLVVSMIVSGWSCEDYFELKRPSQYPWQNAEELELAVRESYLHLSRSPWESPLGALCLIGFAQSDIPQLPPEAPQGNNYAPQYYNRAYATTPPDKEVDWCFKFLYQIVTNSNAALQLLNDSEKAGVDPFESMVESDRETVKRYKGELLFMRAVAYWYLARIYAPPFDPAGSNDGRYFVLRHEYVNKPEELKEGALGSVAEVWAAIRSDLEEAKALLPESYVTSEPQPKGRANKFTACAMLSRVYFITGEHGRAEQECDAILASSMYDLSEDPVVAFNRNGAANGREIIWEIAYSENSGRFDRVPGIFGMSAYNSRESSYCTFVLAYSTLTRIGWMVDGPNGNYAEGPNAAKDKRYAQLYYRLEDHPLVHRPNVWLDKYFRAPDGRRSNRPMIRLAEVFLTRAILRFNRGDRDGAAADLNEVRKRAGLDDIPAAVLTADDIHNERIIELAGEHGDRNYYLIGLRLPLGIGDRDPAKFSPVLAPYSDYYWQVPLTEQQQNQSYQNR
ncbi:MAG: RagB/SusD family nutrient uptake outer membrane protein [Tannerella sp.]|jgi:hypothetical protein|nr:RagB/SusD family nutrient uptake outer membrane protein [Tannerella sp.]